MRNTFSFLVGLGLWCALQTARAAPGPNNDGFQRRNGQMHIVRNGQLRAMTRDARLPTGVLVTKDGFVVDAHGRRTELREGQGCDLKGNVVAVASTAAGGLALATPARLPRAAAAARPPEGQPAFAEVRAVLSGLLGDDREPDERRAADEEEDYENGYNKHAEKAREHRQKDEEKRWKHARKQAEKWEGKRHKGKKWDD